MTESTVIRPARATQTGLGGALERLAPLSGVLAVALWILAVVIIDRNEAAVLGDSDRATGAQIAAYLQSESTTIYLGTVLWGIGAVFFLWFLALLRDRLATAGAGAASWCFASGTVAVASIFGFFAMRLGATTSLETRPAGLSPQAVEALYIGMDGFFVMTWFALGGFYLAAALGGLRSGLFPRTLGWITALLGLVSLVVWIGWVAEFLLPLWIIAVSILMLVRPRATGANS